MVLQDLIFYLFSGLLLFSAMMVVSTRHPIRGILFLILSFLCASVLWMLLEAEFLSLVLIFVYVGAVMMLFLFVVMLLNVEKIPQRSAMGFYLPVGLITAGVLGFFVWQVINPHYFGLIQYPAQAAHGVGYSNTAALGKVLYTDYVLSFELAAVILLAAIVAAVGLIFRGPRSGTKLQNAHQQMQVKKSDRLRIVDMTVEKS